MFPIRHEAGRCFPLELSIHPRTSCDKVLVQSIRAVIKGDICMRNMLSLICVLGISFVSVAQTGQSSWTNLSGLKVGQKIQVVESSSKKESGTFLAVSDSAISFKVGAGEKSVQRPDVRSVKLLTQRRLRNTLIGLGVGAGAGAAIGAGATPSGSFFGKGIAAAVIGVFGGVCGTAVGALWPTHNMVYKVSSH